MPWINQLRPWMRQPQSQVDVDFGNPDANGLVVFANAGTQSEIVRRRPMLAGVAVTVLATPLGRVWDGPAALANGQVDLGLGVGGVGVALDLMMSWSFATKVNVTALGARQILASDYDDAGVNNCFALELSTTNTFQIITVNSGSTTFTASSAAVAAGWHDVEFDIIYTGAGYTAYVTVDGVTAASAASATSLRNPTGVLRIMSSRSASTVGFQGQMLHAAFWSRERYADEKQRFRDNPWSLISAANERVFIPAAVAGLTGSISWDEQSDTAALAATSTVSGAIAWAESADTTSIAANSTANASANWTEVSDTVSLSASVGNDVAAQIGWAESSDAASIAVAATIDAAASWSEASDATALSGIVGNAVSGNISWEEPSDSTDALTTIRVDASIGWAEAGDIVSIGADIDTTVHCLVSWSEDADIVAISAISDASRIRPIPSGYSVLSIDKGYNVLPIDPNYWPN